MGGETAVTVFPDSEIPMFRDYDIGFLAKEFDRSILYLGGMANGHETPGPKFKRMAARTLNKTIEEHFGETAE